MTRTDSPHPPFIVAVGLLGVSVALAASVSWWFGLGPAVVLGGAAFAIDRRYRPLSRRSPSAVSTNLLG